MVSFLVFSILYRLPLAMRIGNSPSTCLWALSAKSNLGQIPWKGQYVYGIFSVSWYKFWLGRKEKGKSNRPGLTYVLTYVQVHKYYKCKFLESQNIRFLTFFLERTVRCRHWMVDRSIDWSDLTENKIPVEICPISECELDLNKLTYLQTVTHSVRSS